MFSWRASGNAAKTTELLSEIEKPRLHGEMLPQVDGHILELVTPEIRAPHHSILQLTLSGPQMLVQLDKMILEFLPIPLIKTNATGKCYSEQAWPLLVQD